MLLSAAPGPSLVTDEESADKSFFYDMTPTFYNDSREAFFQGIISNPQTPSVVNLEAPPGSSLNLVERTSKQADNPCASLIPHQQIAIVTNFTLESALTFLSVPVLYAAPARLSQTGDNAMVICHTLTGSADVSN